MESKQQPLKLTRVNHVDKVTPLSSLFKLHNPFSKSQNNLLSKKEKEDKDLKHAKLNYKKESMDLPSTRPKSTYLQPLKHSQEINLLKPKENNTPFKPMKLSPSSGLSPLDAIKAKAEYELQKGQLRKSQNLQFNKVNEGEMLDLTWAKELDNINKELNKFEAQIGVDKRKSIAHFCSTASPTPPFTNPNFKVKDRSENVRDIRIKQPSPNHTNYKVRNNYNNKTPSPPIDHQPKVNKGRYSYYLPKSSGNLIPHQDPKNLTNNPPNLKHAKSQPTFNQPIIPFTSTFDSSPNNLQIPSFTSTLSSESSDSPCSSSCSNNFVKSPNDQELINELNFERKTRMILENKLKQQNEKCRMLEEEVVYLKALIRKGFKH